MTAKKKNSRFILSVLLTQRIAFLSLVAWLLITPSLVQADLSQDTNIYDAIFDDLNTASDFRIPSLETDSNRVFYSYGLKVFFILPADITVGVGKGFNSNGFEAEVFAGINALRLIFTGENTHVPYGFRLRAALGAGRVWYFEYAYQDIITFGNTSGLLENPHTFSLIHTNGSNGGSFAAIGLGQSIHHAWDNESHAPEKSRVLFFRFGGRF